MHPHSYDAHQKPASNPNPVSTIGFLWHMGYPPPPITMDALKKQIENCIDNNTFTIPENTKNTIIEQLRGSPFHRIPVLMFVVQQSLHSSKIEKIYNALELTHACFLALGIQLASQMNRDFMTSFKNVINTTSYKDRTIGGSLKKLEKWVVGGSSGGSVATDPKVQTLQKRALQLLRIWVDLTINQHLECAPVHDLYKKLSSRGYQFPGAEVELPPLSSFMAPAMGSYGSHHMNQGSVQPIPYSQASTSGYSQQRAGYEARHPHYPASAPATRYGMTPPPHSVPLSRSGSASQNGPIDDDQLNKLASALSMYKKEQGNDQVRQRCLNVFVKMMPRVNARIQVMSDQPYGDEEKLNFVLQIKDEMDIQIKEAEQRSLDDDEFAQLGIHHVPSVPAAPYHRTGDPNSCPFSEPTTSPSRGPEPSLDPWGTTNVNSLMPSRVGGHGRTSSGFASVESDEDLIEGSGQPIRPSEEIAKPKNVDPFAALEDVWES